MSLTKSNLKIAEPCDAAWSEMRGDELRRLCGACDKHVHDLSAMREADARALIESSVGICVRYAHHPDGKVRFADSPRSTTHTAPSSPQLLRQRRGARALMAGAALAMVFGGAAACTSDVDSGPASEPADDAAEAAAFFDGGDRESLLRSLIDRAGAVFARDQATPDYDPDNPPIRVGELGYEPDDEDSGGENNNGQHAPPPPTPDEDYDMGEPIYEPDL